MMKKTIILTVLLAFAGGPSALAASCTGKWSNDETKAASFEILPGKKVHYCLGAECWTERYRQNALDALVFRIGGSAAVVTATPIGEGRYFATWQAGAAHTAAYFHCGE